MREKQIPVTSPQPNDVTPSNQNVNLLESVFFNILHGKNGVLESGNSTSYHKTWQKSFESETKYVPKNFEPDFLRNPEISSPFFGFLKLPLLREPLRHEERIDICHEKSDTCHETEASEKEAKDAVYDCGRGDKRTKKGKIFKHSHGNRRPSRGNRNRLIRDKWEIEGLLPGQPMVPSSVTEKAKQLTDS